jgi:hypothetical protein
MRGLSVGANVVMPNLTQMKYRRLYEIYPEKACIDENATDCSQCLRRQIGSLGRFAGQSRGSRGEFEMRGAGPAQVRPGLVQLQT